MILQSLVDYYEQLVKDGKAETDGWETAKVAYAITIDAEGNVRSIISLKEAEERNGKQVLVSPEQKVPLQKSRSRNISPNFMCDNAKYLLGAWEETGVPEEDQKNREKVQEYFRASAEYHQKILGHTEGIYAKSVCLFFEKWNPEADLEKFGLDRKELLAAGNLVFRSYETAEYLLNDDEIGQAWMDYYTQSLSSISGRCLVTGKEAPIARLHPQFKGVRGAQSSGAALVSYNEAAFESYGKSQGENAPVSEYAASAYGKALDYLLSDDKHRRYMGDATVVFWAETGEDVYPDVMAFMLGDVEESLEDKLLYVMDAVSKGKMCHYDDITVNPETKFFILGLSPNAARISVRFFYQDSFGNLMKNVAEHYERLQIASPAFCKTKYPSVRDILYETVNKNASKKQVQPILVGTFLQAVLGNTRYPAAIFSHLLIRIRADRDINRNRVAMLKAYIMKNYSEKKEVVGHMELNEASENVPYTLGRIFAVLEQIQTAANSSLNTTIKDRYFNSACATPAVVFPRLLKLKNNHTRVLERENKGLQITLEKQLGNLIKKLHEEIPKQLTLEEQGIFIIGYYHQTQKRYEKKEKTEEEN